MTKVRGYTQQITKTPTISASAAYTANDQVGGVMTLEGAMQGPNGGALIGCSVFDKDTQNAEIYVVIFQNNPTMAGSDNAAFSITDANAVLANPLGTIKFAAADYKSWTGNSFVSSGLTNGFPVSSASSDGSLYAVAYTTGTPTYTSTSGLVFNFFFAQD